MGDDAEISKINTIFVERHLNMYTAIKGIYENGVLRLLEPAPNIKKADVVVTFLEEEKATTKKARKPGGLLRLQKNSGKRFDIPKDFNDPIDDLKGIAIHLTD